jgi:hypothetical protein
MAANGLRARVSAKVGVLGTGIAGPMTITVTANSEDGGANALLHSVRSRTSSHCVSGMLHVDSELRFIDYDFYENAKMK